jgi:hypothetical protein
MAAVLVLIMLPLMAAVGFFVGVAHADASIASMVSGAIFVALASGVLIGTLRFARQAEGPGH